MDKESIFKDLIKNNKRICERILFIKPTKTQLIEGLHILIQMNEEENDKNANYWTSFIIDNNQKLQPITILSPKGQKKAFFNNFITQEIHPVYLSTKKIIMCSNREQVFNALKQALKQAQGIYLYGNMGIGKTFIFNKLVHSLIKKNHKVGWINTSQFQLYVYDCMKKEQSYDFWIKKLSDVEYLFIDDIGSEQVNAFFRDNILLTILNTRMEKNKITFFNSNYSLDELQYYQSKISKSNQIENMQAARLLERIKKLAISIKLLGKNRRY